MMRAEVANMLPSRHPGVNRLARSYQPAETCAASRSLSTWIPLSRESCFVQIPLYWKLPCAFEDIIFAIPQVKDLQKKRGISQIVETISEAGVPIHSCHSRHFQTALSSWPMIIVGTYWSRGGPTSMQTGKETDQKKRAEGQMTNKQNLENDQGAEETSTQLLQTAWNTLH